MASMSSEQALALLQKPLQLPCGVALKNRLVKAAMSDSLGDGEGNVTETQARLYERWVEGGVSLSLIGEVQFDARYPEKPGNLVLDEQCDRQSLAQLAERASKNGAQLWPQIGHAGALSHAPISSAKGPSALDLEGLQCAGMTLEEVEALPQAYANAAALAQSAGFGGVEVHAGHGFLLSQFLSPLFNHRQDQYGGSIESRSRIVFKIIEAVRHAVGPDYPIAIKINSSDQLEGGLSEEDSLAVIQLLDQSSIDLIEISGGTYFPGAKAASDSAEGGGAYFLDFAKRARALTTKPLMLTGGIKTRQQAIDAIASGCVDAVGIARAMVLEPDLAKLWLGGQSADPEFPRFESAPPGGITAWYTLRMTSLSNGEEREQSLDLQVALDDYEARDAQRSESWKRKYSSVVF